jgi:hypothetical protein
MPGPISQSSKGPGNESPYAPPWCYKNGPKMCPCGHHEGYHNDDGECLLSHKCGCKGIPDECVTSLDEC